MALEPVKNTCLPTGHGAPHNWATPTPGGNLIILALTYLFDFPPPNRRGEIGYVEKFRGEISTPLLATKHNRHSQMFPENTPHVRLWKPEDLRPVAELDRAAMQP